MHVRTTVAVELNIAILMAEEGSEANRKPLSNSTSAQYSAADEKL
jgi:hypothetical protein